MSARKLIYAEFEGGLYFPWSLKPKHVDPEITIWADGKIRDRILERHNRRTGSDYQRKKFTRRQIREMEPIAYQNLRDNVA